VSLFERKLPKKKREIEDLSLKVDLAARKTKKKGMMRTIGLSLFVHYTYIKVIHLLPSRCGFSR